MSLPKKGNKINCVDVIVDNNFTLWLNEKHIEEKLDHANLPVITRKFRLYKAQI